MTNESILQNGHWPLLFVAVTLTAAAHANERTLWKIGTFDASSGEFKSAGINMHDPKSDPVFVVGQSTIKIGIAFSQDRQTP